MAVSKLVGSLDKRADRRLAPNVGNRLAQRRIAARVRESGRDVPRTDVIRRFGRGWANFERVYRPLADAWAAYDNSGQEAQLLDTSE